MNDLILFAHPTLGVLGIMASVWVLVEALNASEANQQRVQMAAGTAAFCIILAYVVGGYWYVNFYAPEKAAILKGPWPFAHNFFMETKEHVFFGLLVLAILLPIAARQKLAESWSAKAMTIAVAVLVIGNSLAMEGAGAVINHGAKLAFQQAGLK
ncbi:hypothetical protein ACFFWD_08825 [Bradyrhizobium erythrophlei]|uniref:hypothetical protein n=1 Tax=Bradyrhizobium erythrophlei TaxID=1437360 RepID=UPI0035E50CDA